MKKFKVIFSDGDDKININNELYKFIAKYILESYISELIINKNDIKDGE